MSKRQRIKAANIFKRQGLDDYLKYLESLPKRNTIEERPDNLGNFRSAQLNGGM